MTGQAGRSAAVPRRRRLGAALLILALLVALVHLAPVCAGSTPSAPHGVAAMVAVPDAGLNVDSAHSPCAGRGCAGPAACCSSVAMRENDVVASTSFVLTAAAAAVHVEQRSADPPRSRPAGFTHVSAPFALNCVLRT